MTADLALQWPSAPQYRDGMLRIRKGLPHWERSARPDPARAGTSLPELQQPLPALSTCLLQPSDVLDPSPAEDWPIIPNLHGVCLLQACRDLLPHSLPISSHTLCCTDDQDIQLYQL